jgi:hypothetical protein
MRQEECGAEHGRSGQTLVVRLLTGLRQLKLEAGLPEHLDRDKHRVVAILLRRGLVQHLAHDLRQPEDLDRTPSYQPRTRPIADASLMIAGLGTREVTTYSRRCTLFSEYP